MLTAGLPKSNLAKIVACTITSSLYQKQREDKEKWTIIATNFPHCEEVTDFERAIALCSAISPHVVVNGVFHDHLPAQPKSAIGDSA